MITPSYKQRLLIKYSGYFQKLMWLVVAILLLIALIAYKPLLFVVAIAVFVISLGIPGAVALIIADQNGQLQGLQDVLVKQLKKKSKG